MTKKKGAEYPAVYDSAFSEHRVFRTTPVAATILIILIVTAVLSLAQPIRFFDGDEWTLYFVTRNFSNALFSIDRQELEREREEAKSLASRFGDDIGGLGLGSYRQRPDGRFVLEKSPGYFLMVSLFKKMDLERWFNLLLAGFMLMVTLQWAKISLSERETRDVLLLLMFAPASLIMLYRPYMESFASFSLLTSGGLLYLLADHHAENRENTSRLRGILLWFSAGIILGAAIFVRTAILPTLVVFGLHFCYRLFRSFRRGRTGEELINGLFLSVGILFFLAVLLYYNAMVNGAALTPGYALGKPKQSIYCFSFQRLFFPEPVHPWAIIVRNLIRMPEHLVNGYPLLLIGLPGIVLASKRFRRDIFLLFLGWFASIYFLYLQFLVYNGRHFMVIGRLYLPALAPLAIFSALFLAGLGTSVRRIMLGFLIVIAVISYVNFLCQIGVDPFQLGILRTFSLKNWIAYP